MRIRTIKPEFWGHEILAKQSEFTRLLAIALLNYADDDGYFLAAPQSIRGAVFPFLDDSRKIQGALNELSRIGYVKLGKLQDGRAVGLVVKFANHQVINRPQASKFKDSSTFTDDSVNTPTQLNGGMEWKGKEWKREEQGNGTSGDCVETLQERISRWFGRRPSTKWDEKELAGLRKVKTTSQEDIELLEKRYTDTAPDVVKYRKQAIGTLLNNWNSQIDIARRDYGTVVNENPHNVTGAELADLWGAKMMEQIRAADEPHGDGTPEDLPPVDPQWS